MSCARHEHVLQFPQALRWRCTIGATLQMSRSPMAWCAAFLKLTVMRLGCTNRAARRSHRTVMLAARDWKEPPVMPSAAIDLFSDEVRRNPFARYDQIRATSPVMHDPATGLWMIFDYDGVLRALTDHETFSSRHGPAEWLVFMDPPRQAKLRALISRAFTPRSIALLEPRIAELSRELMDDVVARARRGEVVDVAEAFAVPLPMRVIAEMLGVPPADRARFTRWSDVILQMSQTVPRGAGADVVTCAAMTAFMTMTAEMGEYLADVLAQRRAAPRDDLLTRLASAEIEGERLTPTEILGFFQLLLVAGQETTTNLINNALVCLMDHPDQLARLRAEPALLPSAIEEVLRFRSPVQWMFRVTRRDVEMHGQLIPARRVVLAMIGSANRDPAHFKDAARFDIARDPNPHIAFGHGVHFCLGAPLARLEARIALTDFLSRVSRLEYAATSAWPPRKALHVHGPDNLPLRLQTA
jgi:cytochrome P450